ncbi:MAG: Stp1/IreP family PP2C-type Ser/Thr phosphatase [Actinomycetota bacterium]
MKVIAAAATDIGLVREGNEDSYLVDEPLFAVADGMGGHRGGEVASQLALETVEKLFREGEGDLAEQVQEANRAVFERSVEDLQVAGMGTTLTAALVEGDRIRLAHVGDSRAYLLRDGDLRRLTEDHTLVHRMVTEGEISETEAEAHPQRSVLTRALGVDMFVDVDDDVVQVRSGDRLLLCTDGLTGMVPEDRIKEMLQHVADPAEAAERLVRSANEAGGVDNITVVILDFSDDGQAQDRLALVARAKAPAEKPAKASRRRAFPWKRITIWLGAAVAVIVLGLVGLRAYLDTQWYVGVSEGNVAIYRGIPAEVAGFRLHHVVVETTIPAEVAESFGRDLDQGIIAEDREAANAIVEQIRSDVEAAQRNEPGP